MALPLLVLLALAPYFSAATEGVENEYWWGGVPERVRRVSDDGPWVGLGKREYRFTPFASVGVLSDMKQFFDDLRNNMDSLETLGQEERDALLGKSTTTSERDQHVRPAATAAYLHALRNQRPSYKIRNFVDSSEPVTLRGTNRYDPSLLWTGLGKRRR